MLEEVENGESGRNYRLLALEGTFTVMPSRQFLNEESRGGVG